MDEALLQCGVGRASRQASAAIPEPRLGQYPAPLPCGAGTTGPWRMGQPLPGSRAPTTTQERRPAPPQAHARGVHPSGTSRTHRYRCLPAAISFRAGAQAPCHPGLSKPSYPICDPELAPLCWFLPLRISMRFIPMAASSGSSELRRSAAYVSMSASLSPVPRRNCVSTRTTYMHAP